MYIKSDEYFTYDGHHSYLYGLRFAWIDESPETNVVSEKTYSQIRNNALNKFSVAKSEFEESLTFDTVISSDRVLYDNEVRRIYSKFFDKNQYKELMVPTETGEHIYLNCIITNVEKIEGGYDDRWGVIGFKAKIICDAPWGWTDKFHLRFAEIYDKTKAYRPGDVVCRYIKHGNNLFDMNWFLTNCTKSDDQGPCATYNASTGYDVNVGRLTWMYSTELTGDDGRNERPWEKSFPVGLTPGQLYHFKCTYKLHPENPNTDELPSGISSALKFYVQEHEDNEAASSYSTIHPGQNFTYSSAYQTIECDFIGGYRFGFVYFIPDNIYIKELSITSAYEDHVQAFECLTANSQMSTDGTPEQLRDMDISSVTWSEAHNEFRTTYWKMIYDKTNGLNLNPHYGIDNHDTVYAPIEISEGGQKRFIIKNRSDSQEYIYPKIRMRIPMASEARDTSTQIGNKYSCLGCQQYDECINHSQIPIKAMIRNLTDDENRGTCVFLGTHSTDVYMDPKLGSITKAEADVNGITPALNNTNKKFIRLLPDDNMFEIENIIDIDFEFREARILV